MFDQFVYCWPTVPLNIATQKLHWLECDFAKHGTFQSIRISHPRESDEMKVIEDTSAKHCTNSSATAADMARKSNPLYLTRSCQPRRLQGKDPSGDDCTGSSVIAADYAGINALIHNILHTALTNKSCSKLSLASSCWKLVWLLCVPCRYEQASSIPLNLSPKKKKSFYYHLSSTLRVYTVFSVNAVAMKDIWSIANKQNIVSRKFSLQRVCSAELRTNFNLNASSVQEV